MKKIRAAIVGYGNIGKYVLEALQAAEDFEIAGIIRRDAANVPEELKNYTVATEIESLGKVDVAILCTPSRSVQSFALKLLEKGINTVDSFDIHTQVAEQHATLGKAAAQHGAVSIMSAGWDPGSDSVVRALLEACAPKGITYTNFGPGMSMGHTVAVKAIDGVKAALSMTIPTGTGIHRRMVYVVHDETHVMRVQSVDAMLDMGHGVNLTRKGVSGKTQNQLFEFNMKINNPALTAQILVSSARASMLQKPGCYTLIEIPMIDLLPGDRTELIRHLV